MSNAKSKSNAMRAGASQPTNLFIIRTKKGRHDNNNNGEEAMSSMNACTHFSTTTND